MYTFVINFWKRTVNQESDVWILGFYDRAKKINNRDF